VLPPQAAETQPMQSVKVTGVDFGRKEVFSPPWGGSIIHSIELPLEVAGEGRPGAAGGHHLM
jgi:hypothetical protein